MCVEGLVVGTLLEDIETDGVSIRQGRSRSEYDWFDNRGRLGGEVVSS